MRWRTKSLIALGLMVTTAAPALACNFWFSSTFMSVVQNPVISVGLQNWDYYRIISADAAFKVADKAVVRPGIGNCSYTGEGDSESQMVYGAMAGYNIWNDPSGKVAVNAQAGFEYSPFDGGSERNIPIGAAVAYSLSGGSSSSRPAPSLQGGGSGMGVTLFGGVAMNMYSYSYGEGEFGGDVSSNDVSIFAGAMVATGNFTITGGITSWDGETALNVGAGMALGSASNAIRKVGSLFRK